MSPCPREIYTVLKMPHHGKPTGVFLKSPIEKINGGKTIVTTAFPCLTARFYGY